MLVIAASLGDYTSEICVQSEITCRYTTGQSRTDQPYKTIRENILFQKWKNSKDI